MSKDNGGPAFPVSTGNPDAPWQDGNATAQFPGMTLRDYFAAKAMHQILCGAVFPTRADREKGFPIVAEVAYEMADAMIAERNKQ